MSVEKCWLRLFGGSVCLVSAATFGLGIADVIVTWKTCDSAKECSSSSLSYILAWIAVGIWASIPIFINGVIALWVSTHLRASHKGWLAFISFLSSLFFSPGLVIISALELYYTYKDTGLPSVPAVNQPRFGIPLAIGIGGALLFVHVVSLFLYAVCRCCCGDSSDSNVIVVSAAGGNGRINPGYTSSYGWNSNVPSAAPKQKKAIPQHVNYYASGGAPTRSTNVGATGIYAGVDSGNNYYQIPRPGSVLVVDDGGRGPSQW